MPFTLVAFSENINEAGVFVNLTGVPDQHVRVVGDQIVVSDFDMIIATAAFMGALGEEVRVITPRLRRINPLYITPLSLALFAGSPPAIMYHGDSPIPLDKNEALMVESSAVPGAPEQHAVGVWLADVKVTPITGEIHTVNCVANMAQVLDTWEFSEIVLPDALPVGRYAVVGARLEAAGGILFRFVPVGAVNRPGGVVAQDEAGVDPFMQRFGRLGQWFEFDTTTPPAVELLGSAALGAADYNVFMDVIKL